MQNASMTVFGPALTQILNGILPSIPVANFSAHLLSPTTQFDATVITSLADLTGFQIGDQAPYAISVSGCRIEADANGAPAFHTDTIVFGDPITTPPFRYVALAFGLLGVQASNKPLLGYLDLAPSSGAVEVVNGPLSIAPPSEGWFKISA